jgi:hypothetical protein
MSWKNKARTSIGQQSNRCKLGANAYTQGYHPLQTALQKNGVTNLELITPQK